MKIAESFGFNRRVVQDKVVAGVMRTLTVASLLMVVLVAVGLLLKSMGILRAYSLWDLLTGTEWYPLSGEYGFAPFILSSLYVTLLSVAIALPIALLSALFLTDRSRPWVRKVIFPVLDILAGIPSVVYGLWGTIIIVPWIADTLGPLFVDYSSGYSLLAGGLVLSVMIIPLMVSLFVEIFSAIPTELKEAAASRVVLRKAFPGIVAATALAVSKAFGETLAVLMVCGNMVDIPHSLFDSAYPLPALIANNYGEMLSLPLYESALMFAALILFVIILVFNGLSRILLRRIEKKLKL
jgi:phosphate transport system permease protein